LKWYLLAAEKQHSGAQHTVASFYALGLAGSTNDQKAVEWFRRAAEQDEAIAQYNLGIHFKKGVGVATNHVEAVKWLRKAAEQNYAAAQKSLGNCYQRGEGVDQDNVEAYAWWSLAAATVSQAAVDRDALAIEMSPDQILAGFKRTKQLRAIIEQTLSRKPWKPQGTFYFLQP
jgi:TPR repeat protein